MVYVWPNSLGTIHGISEREARKIGYVPVSEEDYADLVETKKMWFEYTEERQVPIKKQKIKQKTAEEKEQEANEVFWAWLRENKEAIENGKLSVSDYVAPEVSEEPIEEVEEFKTIIETVYELVDDPTYEERKQAQLAEEAHLNAIKEIEDEIELCKAELIASDYKAFKYFEGWITEEEYIPVKESRHALRIRINELEANLNTLKGEVN